ncbi:MAG: O-antigen ligase family protein [bacterium]|nr:O-antigen ligase family protein [bacterium]
MQRANIDQVTRVLKWVLRLEPFAILGMLIVFWTPDPARVNSLVLLLPFLLLRLLVYRRIAPASPLNGLLIGLLALGVINVLAAPTTWGWWVLGRPVMGVLLAVSLADYVRRDGAPALESLLHATTILALLMGVISLLWSQWTIKSVFFQDVIALLPPYPRWEFTQQLLGSGFNVNEIAGGLVWLAPLAAGLALAPVATPAQRVRRWTAAAAFSLLAFSLVLGQSRFALFGLIISLYGVIITLIPRGTWRLAAKCALLAFLIFEMLLFTGAINPVATTALARDESSLVSRLYMWQAAASIVRDHPLTGIGMNRFRAGAVRALYPVPGYETAVLPHAHNEWAQIGADFGVPGLIGFTALLGISLAMLWRAWKGGQPVAIGIAAGLVGHAVYGLGDAITLFDRLIFIFWWLIGLTLAVWAAAAPADPAPASQRSKNVQRTMLG